MPKHLSRSGIHCLGKVYGKGVSTLPLTHVHTFTTLTHTHSLQEQGHSETSQERVHISCSYYPCSRSGSLCILCHRLPCECMHRMCGL